MNRLNRLAEKDADSNDVIILSEHEVECLRKTALVRRENGTYKYPVGPYVLFLLETGMRVGELCALKWENVQWDEDSTVVSIMGTRHLIKIREGDDTGYRAREGSVKNMHSRHIVLKSEAAEILEEIYNESKDTSPQGYVFVNRRLNPTNPSNAGRLINKFYRAAGLVAILLTIGDAAQQSFTNEGDAAAALQVAEQPSADSLQDITIGLPEQQSAALATQPVDTLNTMTR